MTEQDLRRVLQESTANIHWSKDQQTVLQSHAAGGSVRPRKKLVFTVILALMLTATLSIAVAESLGWGLTDFFRFRQEEKILQEHPEVVQTKIPQQFSGSDNYTVTITEAVYDGFASHVVATIKPKDSSILLLDETVDVDMGIPALNLSYMEFDFFDEDAHYPTIGEWAAEHGKKPVKYGYMLSKESGGDYSQLEDGTQVLYESTYYDNGPDTLPMTLSVLFYDPEKGPDQGKQEEVEVKFTLQKTPPKWVRNFKPALEVKECGIVIDEIKLSTTVMATYLHVQFHALESETTTRRYYYYWFLLAEEDGTLREKAHAGIDHAGQGESQASFSPLGDVPPSTIPLLITDHEDGTGHLIRIDVPQEEQP